jgi:putative holliday junction resolvase
LEALVIGLPLSLDGVERSSALKVRQLAQKFTLSLDVPVFLQDERLTSREAEDYLRELRHNARDIRELVDSESATIILRDFMLDETSRLELLSQEKNNTSTD